ncbi:hypothetical protein F7734_00940 [Scytonema sp. UIC 10036]|uniref:hypothetical protein n=1 Tax=Scytonema sp. UIC 10036 TaxID=2304196 RepID=UPI0012DA76E1|nr:hypothetical protein [Scytonema sp. UIC 10036]MUG91141.1 hypothetical protein [Scytonema sp. UIC 10036]
MSIIFEVADTVLVLLLTTRKLFKLLDKLLQATSTRRNRLGLAISVSSLINGGQITVISAAELLHQI